MIEPVWTRAEVQLFWHRQDLSPVWLRFVEIEKVKWNDPKRARIILKGMLPVAQQLLKIADGDALELLWNMCGPPDDYHVEDIVMRFSNVSLKRRWIPTLSTEISKHNEPIMVYVSLECELQIDV